MQSLARGVHSSTSALGYEREGRAYAPHLTVARASRPRDVHETLNMIGADPIGRAWPVEQALLFESDTRPDGAVHTVRHRLSLRGTSSPEAHQ